MCGLENEDLMKSCVDKHLIVDFVGQGLWYHRWGLQMLGVED